MTKNSANRERIVILTIHTNLCDTLSQAKGHIEERRVLMSSVLSDLKSARNDMTRHRIKRKNEGTEKEKRDSSPFWKCVRIGQRQSSIHMIKYFSSVLDKRSCLRLTWVRWRSHVITNKFQNCRRKRNPRVKYVVQRQYIIVNDKRYER